MVGSMEAARRATGRPFKFEGALSVFKVYKPCMNFFSVFSRGSSPGFCLLAIRVCAIVVFLLAPSKFETGYCNCFMGVLNPSSSFGVDSLGRAGTCGVLWSSRVRAEGCVLGLKRPMPMVLGFKRLEALASMPRRF